ncbi:MAG TPA: pyruvate dehydrogenase complex dihydrolipoamide acetyltransferase [Pyrinomonadaceae bacterium]|nr:pyruvate dehydrogenase complex dihydrolipoamide acetyltransferase [Pyrinomonadaceae bacterium]
MATQVVMPKLSPTMEEGQISRWLKKEGDKVSMGEPLAEIDTDKATMEMQALSNGVLRKIIIQAGESAPLGQMIAVIGEPDEDISALLSQAGSGTQGAQAAPQQQAGGEAKAEAGQKAPAAADAGAQQPPPQPAASGNGAQAAQGGDGQATGRLVVSPLAARMAAEAGINLRTLTGSGPGGRIIKRDIEAAMSAGKPAEEAAQAPQRHLRAVQPGAQPAQGPAAEGASAYRDEPTSVMRQTIARRLVTSIGPVPHFFLTTEIEMDRVVEMRNSVKDLDPELKFSINDVIVKVAAAALIQHPQVNASFQDRNIRYYEHADIGVAVAIEDGLITPVVRAADQKSLSQIAAEVRELAERARSRKLMPEEYTGATFSISNLGMLGIDEFTAVINPPEAAILAVGAVTPKPVVRDNQVVVRQMMRVTMSCDHRVIDGATGARFLQTFKRLLENPLLMIV